MLGIALHRVDEIRHEIGATLQLTTVVSNYGARTWTPGAFALSYHIYDSGGTPVIWDGARGRLPSSVPPSTSVTVPISVALPVT